MFNIFTKSITWGNQTLSLETGKMARQADGSVTVRYGGTMVLCTVVANPECKADADFLALSVHYQEKTFSAGKIPGSFFKREGKPSEREILVSRLIDRPLRPLFPAAFKNEVQVICSVLSHDLTNDPDVPALIGASAALTLSGLPFFGPIGAARVGFLDGEYVLNPTLAQMRSSSLDLVVAGTQKSILMVESEAQEFSEEGILEALQFGQKSLQPVIKMILDLAAEAAKDPWELLDVPHDLNAFDKKLETIASDPLREIFENEDKGVRVQKYDQLKESILKQFEDQELILQERVILGLKKLSAQIMRSQILEKGRRLDGRDSKTIRPIMCEVDVLPNAHGSALFTRGGTQALVVSTLGTSEDAQVMDVLEGEYRERFMLHYNFPPFSVGSVGRLGAPGRREIGHGKLAWRALRPVLPEADQFPYTLRIVSEILESDGSSSMATVCGASLALMDAGVHIMRPVAGIAMGLVKEGDTYAVLSDILGEEDSLGDMDFKVAGTIQGITALQMDLKMTGISFHLIQVALEQAREGRLYILQKMNKSLTEPRKNLNMRAPRVVTFTVPKEKIREIIGPGGKVIREICEVTGAKIDIQSGTVQVFASNGQNLEQAVNKIRLIIYEPQIGDVFSGKVVQIVPFGAFVNFIGNRDGLVHISELAEHRVAQVEDIVRVGDSVTVKIIGIDPKGKVKLSMKQAKVTQESDSCTIL